MFIENQEFELSTVSMYYIIMDLQTRSNNDVRKTLDLGVKCNCDEFVIFYIK